MDEVSFANQDQLPYRTRTHCLVLFLVQELKERPRSSRATCHPSECGRSGQPKCIVVNAMTAVDPAPSTSSHHITTSPREYPVRETVRSSLEDNYAIAAILRSFLVPSQLFHADLQPLTRTTFQRVVNGCYSAAAPPYPCARAPGSERRWRRSWISRSIAARRHSARVLSFVVRTSFNELDVLQTSDIHDEKKEKLKVSITSTNTPCRHGIVSFGHGHLLIEFSAHHRIVSSHSVHSGL